MASPLRVEKPMTFFIFLYISTFEKPKKCWDAKTWGSMKETKFEFFHWSLKFREKYDRSYRQIDEMRWGLTCSFQKKSFSKMRWIYYLQLFFIPWFGILQCISLIWTCLTWLNFAMVVWIYAKANFRYCHVCFKSYEK